MGSVVRVSEPGEVPEEVALSWLRPRDMAVGEGGEVGRLLGEGGEGLRRKMWTVSVVEETQRRVEERLNDML